MNHLDLFSGIGGFALAARWAGIETIQFIEIDKFCQKVLEKNFPNVPIYDDIKTFDATYLNGKVDILTGGFPCQPFSVAGKKQGSKDERYLWPEMFRIIKECNPAWIISENVSGIIPMLDPILEDLENEGYDWKSFLIPASAVGAPHKRERVWIIANRNGERCDNRCNIGKKRYLQADCKQYVEKVQSEWTQFQPQSWSTFNAQDWLSNSNSVTGDQTHKRAKPVEKECNTWLGHSRQNRTNIAEFNWKKDQPPIPGVDDGLPHGLDRNKSLGNAIVPQVVYPMMKLIYEIEMEQINVA